MRSGHSFSTSYEIFLPRIWHWSQAKTWRVRLSIWSDIAFPTFLKENREKKSVSHCFYKQPSVYHIDTQVRCIYPFILSTHMPTILKHCSILVFFFLVYIMQWPGSSKRKNTLGILLSSLLAFLGIVSVCTCDNVSDSIFLSWKVSTSVINSENYQVRFKIHLFNMLHF